MTQSSGNTEVISPASKIARAPYEMIPPWPFYSDDEVAAAVDVLRSGKVNQWTGSVVQSFQDAFAEKIGQPFAIAVANGSVALESALRALGVGSGDEVIVTPRSFIASASSVDLVGATCVFADVSCGSQVIAPETIEPKITARTKAIMPVHLHGRPCDMPGIMALAENHRLLVIEDCAQSHGASIDGRLVGSFGHASAFSFCQDKIISTGGEGGMVLFGDEAAWHRAWAFKDHGKSLERVFGPVSSVGYRWLHESLGTNLRMTGMQAAIGLVQLQKLEQWVAARGHIANRLKAALSDFSCVRIEPLPQGHVHAYYRLDFTIREEALRAGWTRDRLLVELTAEKLPAFTGPCPELYREQAYAKHKHYPSLPNAERLGRSSMALLCHPTITEEYLLHAEGVIARVFNQASDRKGDRPVSDPISPDADRAG